MLYPTELLAPVFVSVGTARFELATPRSQSECSTGLSHVPKQTVSLPEKHAKINRGRAHAPARVARSTREGAAARKARARWLTSFFLAGSSSPKLVPSAGTKKSGS